MEIEELKRQLQTMQENERNLQRQLNKTLAIVRHQDVQLSLGASREKELTRRLEILDRGETQILRFFMLW